MILQVSAYAGQFVPDLDADRPEVFGIADTGNLEKVRRVERPSGKDDFLACMHLLGHPSLDVLDADGPAAFDQDARGQSVRNDREVPSVADRGDEAAGDARSDAVGHGAVARADAFLVTGVQIVVVAVAGLLAGLDPGFGYGALDAKAAGLERPVAPVNRARAVAPAFRLAEVGRMSS